jgi:hypothetical protein
MMTECRRLLNAACRAVGPDPAPVRPYRGGALSGFARKWLMATDDADPGVIRDIVAGRLRVMIGA